jgi:hypothetical protein
MVKKWIQTLRKIFTNRKKIIEGVKNRVFKKEHIEKIAFERIEICQDCNRFDPEGDSCAVPNTQPCCAECGCCLALKTRSLASQCEHPDGPRWKAEMTPEEQDKLYKEINFDPNK